MFFCRKKVITNIIVPLFAQFQLRSASSYPYLSRTTGIFPITSKRFPQLINIKERTIMANAENFKIVNYDDVKALKDNQAVLLIDVREPSELKETGVLPGSINIPLGQVENILKNTPPEEFSKQFGRPKPSLEIPLVFSCAAGGRSAKASKVALQLGYKDVSNYSGGWKDWAKHMHT